VAKRTDSKVDRKRKLEELKRQQRAKERRKTILTLGVATVVGLALLGGVIGAAVAENRKEERAKKKAAAEAQQKIDAARAELKTLGVTAAAASCSPVATDNPIPEGGKHVQTKVEYKDAPPTGGEHAGQTLPIDSQNFYERETPDEFVEQAVHDLEHGVIVAWYDSQLPAADVDALKKIAANTMVQQAANPPDTRPKNRLLVLPWHRGNFGGDKHFVLTAWGHKQVCGKASGEAVQTFMEQFENKDAPEPGFAV
jgi:hypothetical protein